MTRHTLRSVGLSTVLLISAGLAGPGCGSPRRRWTPNQGGNTTTTGAGTTVAATGVVASGSPREQLEQLDGLLRQQGMQPMGPAVHGSLAANGMIAYAVNAAANVCYTLAVIGEQPSGQNIDIIVIDPYGRPAAHHVRPDNHPWVSFCVSQNGRFIARVQMASGSGGYFYAAYHGPANRRMDLSSFYGDEPHTAVQTAQMDGPTQQRLAALDRHMQQRGFSRVGEPAGVVLNSTDPRDFQLNLQQGICYTFATLGGAGAVDTDIFLNDSGGQRLEADATTARDAAIQHCAQVTGSYVLSVRMNQGQGSLFTVGYVQQAAQATSQQPVMATTSTAGASLQENFALLDADMHARGYESYGNQTTGRLDTSGLRNFEIQLEGERCYAILAVGDSTVTDLDLLLFGPGGDTVDQDTATDARPTVRVCPRSSGNYYMQVQMTAGSGAYVYAPYRWLRGTSGSGLEGVSWVLLSEVTALLGVEGYAPDPGFTPNRGRLRRQGASATHDIVLSTGQCYAFVAVGGEGINDLDLTLSRGNTQLATDYGSANAFPSVRHCAQSDGRYRIRVTAAAGSGSYRTQVFSLSEE